SILVGSEPRSGEIRASRTPQRSTLATVDRGEGVELEARSDARPRLHLDEDERPAVEKDEIDLVPPPAHVSRDEPEAASAQIEGSDPLAEPAERTVATASPLARSSCHGRTSPKD